MKARIRNAIVIQSDAKDLLSLRARKRQVLRFAQDDIELGDCEGVTRTRKILSASPCLRGEFALARKMK